MAFVTRPALLPSDFGFPPAADLDTIAHKSKKPSGVKKEPAKKKKIQPKKPQPQKKQASVLKKKKPDQKKKATPSQRTLPWKS